MNILRREGVKVILSMCLWWYMKRNL